jgi:hypothetical protein
VSEIPTAARTTRTQLTTRRRTQRANSGTSNDSPIALSIESGFWIVASSRLVPPHGETLNAHVSCGQNANSGACGHGLVGLRFMLQCPGWRLMPRRLNQAGSHAAGYIFSVTLRQLRDMSAYFVAFAKSAAANLQLPSAPSTPLQSPRESCAPFSPPCF